MIDAASFQIGVTCGACAVHRVVEAKQAEIDALKAQNAELLAALEHLVAAIEFTPLSIRALTHLAAARKAIVKARGESCK